MPNETEKEQLEAIRKVHIVIYHASKIAEEFSEEFNDSLSKKAKQIIDYCKRAGASVEGATLLMQEQLEVYSDMRGFEKAGIVNPETLDVEHSDEVIINPKKD